MADGGLEVRLFTPTVSESVRELIPEVEKPRMTAGRAAIIKVMSVYCEMPLSQIEVQKLTYFLVRGGPSSLPSRKRQRRNPVLHSCFGARVFLSFL
jgi:hypothetical protein